MARFTGVAMRKLFLPILTAAVLAAAAISQIIPQRHVESPAPVASQVFETPTADQLVVRTAAEQPQAFPTAVALPPVSNPWLALIPLAVPLLVASVKNYVPTLPKVWLPVIAASIGLALALFDYFTGQLGGNPLAVAFLGSAGTGLREIYDQIKKVLAVPNV